jgi:hypothetical protein
MEKPSRKPKSGDDDRQHSPLKKAIRQTNAATTHFAEKAHRARPRAGLPTGFASECSGSMEGVDHLPLYRVQGVRRLDIAVFQRAAAA